MTFTGQETCVARIFGLAQIIPEYHQLMHFKDHLGFNGYNPSGQFGTVLLQYSCSD